MTDKEGPVDFLSSMGGTCASADSGNLISIMPFTMHLHQCIRSYDL